jgi:putative membrane protein insertion efficiency factor
VKILRLILASPFLAVLYFYRFLISPVMHLLLGPLGCGCRFEPTCSRYAIKALKIHPLHRALWLIIRRVSRCHPWGGEGYDPVPPRELPPRFHVYDLPAEGQENRADDINNRSDAEGDDREPEEKEEHHREQRQAGDGHE